MALVLIVGLMVEVVIGRSRQLPVISSDRSWPLFDAFLVLLFFWAKRFPARNTYTHKNNIQPDGRDTNNKKSFLFYLEFGWRICCSIRLHFRSRCINVQSKTKHKNICLSDGISTFGTGAFQVAPVIGEPA
jgi:hypothetical protein